MKQLSRFIGLFAICFFVSFGSAQTPTGTIEGVVTDKSGATIAGASISIIQTSTNKTRVTSTDSAGRFVVPFIDPGIYTVTVDANGFNRGVEKNVLVQVTQSSTVNFKLQVGKVTETVQVNASAASLDEGTTSMGQTVQSSTFLELPDNGRNPFDFALLVPGVQDGPGNSEGASTPHIGGSRNANNEEQIDGMTNILPENNVGNSLAAYQPIEDSVQEENVQTSVLPAEYGRFSGGTISLVTKSGTNKFHGSFFEFIQNGGLDAVPFGSPGVPNTNPKPDMSQYQTGGTVGGPIIHDRAFFFFALEDNHTRAGQNGTYSVPNPAWSSGDFTSLFGSTTPYLFDPDTVTQNSAGVYQRQPFQDTSGRYNVLPASRLSPVATKALSYYPAPNIANAGTYNNFLRTGTVPTDYWHFDSREDGDVTKKWHSFLRYSELHQTGTYGLSEYNNAASPGLNGGIYHQNDYSGSFNNTITFTPTLLGEFRYGVSKQAYNQLPIGGGFNPSNLGFDAGYVAQASAPSEFEIFPNFQFNGNGSFTQLGAGGYAVLQEDPLAQDINASLVKITHGHTIKVGGEFRAMRENFYQLVYPSGEFSSDDSWTRQFPQTYDSSGFSVASLILGLPTSGVITKDIKYLSTSQYLAFFGQDDWKVSPKFTLNFGVRYDFDIPREEQQNQLSYWNPTAVSPLQRYQSQLAGNLAAAGENCPSCGDLQGAIFIAGGPNAQYGRRQGPTDKLDIGPRFGLAYNVTPKVLVRAGAGIVFQPSAMQASGTTGGSGYDGFGNGTNFVSSYNGELSPPVASLYSPDPALPASAMVPFASGYNTSQALTPSCQASTACLQGIDIGGSTGGGGDYFDSYRNPYSIQYNANVQYAARDGITIELGYLANKGVFLIQGDPGKPYDQLTPNTLAAYGCSVGASTANCQITQQVPNPFYSIIGSPSSPFYQNGLPLGSPTIAFGQLLKHWPQYANVYSFRKPGAASMFNGLTFRADKNFNDGLAFTVSFTDGREFDNSASAVNYLGATSQSYANQYNPGAEWSIGAQNVSYMIAASFVYQLPFGKGKPFLNSAGKGANALINGWQVSGIENWSTGTPLVMGGVDNGTTAEALWANQAPFSQRPDWSGTTAKLSSPSYKEWFNTSVYSLPLPYEIGNAPRTLRDVNNPSYQNIDLQLAKNTKWREDEPYVVQLRLEGFNAFNHGVLGGPNMGLTSGQFGVITGYANNARRIQVGAKFTF